MAGHFDFDSIARRISAKMIDRHPHVFADESRDKSAEDQTRDWEKTKAEERRNAGRSGVLDDVALGLPALLRAVKLQKRAARVGFDWPDATHVLDKVAEETGELVQAMQGGDRDHLEEEFGDLLFVIANLARHLDIDAELALRAAASKFRRRFEAVEALAGERGIDLHAAGLETLDRLWEEVKAAQSRNS